MERVRIQIKKGPEARFISHLDFQRLLGRALRRGRLPVAMSEGFNPHPRISFASALAVGTTSEAEFVEFDLEPAMDPEEFGRLLDRQLPPGFRVVRAGQAPLTGPGLMSLIEAASYRLGLSFPGGEKPRCEGVEAAEVEAALGRFLARDKIQLVKETKSGPREVDIRPLVYELRLLSPDHLPGTHARFDCLLYALLATGSRGSLRPEDLFRAIAAVEPLFVPAKLVLVHRTGLFKIGPKGWQSPWDNA